MEDTRRDGMPTDKRSDDDLKRNARFQKKKEGHKKVRGNGRYTIIESNP